VIKMRERSLKGGVKINKEEVEKNDNQDRVG
jgi:hypothetical protein